MPRRTSRVAALAVFLWLSGPARAEEVTFTLVHLNDVYEILPPREGDLGGLARLATLRKLLEETRGPGRVFTVLAGDCFSPSVMGDAPVLRDGQPTGEKLAGRQMVAVLNAMRLDFATFGNHEFDVKRDEFRARLAESPGTRWFSSNARVSGDALPRDVPRYVAFTVPGKSTACAVKVGMFGLTLNFKTDPDQPDYADFDEVKGAAGAAVGQLQRDGCDVIVGVTHLDLADDKLLAEGLPGVHLIAGGHEHQNNYVAQPDGSSRAPVAKADANARTVYVHDFSYDTTKGTLTVKSRLRFVDESLGSDPLTSEAVKRWKEAAFDGLRADFRANSGGAKARAVKVLQCLKKLPEELTNAELESPKIDVGQELEGREVYVRTGSTNLTRFILKVMRRKAGDDTELAVLNSGSIRIDDVIRSAGVSVYDIFRLLPYPVKVYRVKMKGSLLRSLLEAGRSAPVRKEGAFLQADNYDFDRKEVVKPRGPIEDQRVYVVAIGEYLLTGRQKHLAHVLPRREVGQIRALKVGTDGLELIDHKTLGSEPFDLLPAVAEALAAMDRNGKSPAEVAKLEAMEPSETPFQSLDPVSREGYEQPRVATFTVRKKPCEEEAKAPSQTQGVAARELEPRFVPDPQMRWWQVVLIFAVSGLVSGMLASLALLNWPSDPGPPRSDRPRWRRFLEAGLPALLYRAAAGMSGAFVALFLMVLDRKIKPTLGDVEILTYISTGVVAGFLGLNLLNRAADAFRRRPL